MINSSSDKAVKVLANVCLMFLSLCALFPFVLLIIASFTENGVAIAEGYSFTPSKFSLAAYEYLVQEWRTIGRGYLMTIIVTVIGTATGLLITSMFSYALIVQDLPGRSILTVMVLISMLFNGGIVASYFIYSNVMHIKDTIFALIVPGLLMNAFNIILMRNFFKDNVSQEILESARIDGSGELRIFAQMVLPLSVPILATIGLLQAIGYWNDWTNGLYYVNRTSMFTIQVLLNRMISDIQALAQNASTTSNAVLNIPTVSIRMAIAFVAILPILVVYPFLQKYFASGIALGAVKG